MYIGESERQARRDLHDSRLSCDICTNLATCMHVMSSLQKLWQMRITKWQSVHRYTAIAAIIDRCAADDLPDVACRCARFLSAHAARGPACCSLTSWTAWRPRAARAPTARASWTEWSANCWLRSAACRPARTSSSLGQPTGAAPLPPPPSAPLLSCLLWGMPDEHRAPSTLEVAQAGPVGHGAAAAWPPGPPAVCRRGRRCCLQGQGVRPCVCARCDHDAQTDTRKLVIPEPSATCAPSTKHSVVPGASAEGACLQVLRALTRKFALAADVDLDAVAAECAPTFTGADLYALAADAWTAALYRVTAEVRPLELRGVA